MTRVIETLLKAPARLFWRLARPVRRALMQRLNAHLAHVVAEGLAGPSARLDAVTAALGRIEESVNVGRHVAEHQSADANLLLDGLVREVARLQMQIEALREAIDEAQGHGLALVGRQEAEEPDQSEAGRRAG